MWRAVQMEKIISPLEPVYDSHSKILILGTIPSPNSREMGFYYGHPQNRFWRILSAVLQEPAPQGAEQKAAYVRRHGIALYDVLRACEIQGASDASIQNPVASDLCPIFRAAQIRAVFTTGKKAAALYKKYQQQRTGMPALLLPSPSPANCAASMQSLVEAYRLILQYLR